MVARTSLDLSRFGSLGKEARIRLLLKAIKVETPPTVGLFLGTDSQEEVYVLDNGEAIDVADRAGALCAAADLLGIHVAEPMEVHGAGSSKITFQVWGYPSPAAMLISEPCLLGDGSTAQDALSAALGQLECLVGSHVLSLPTWAACKAPEHAATLKKRRDPPPPPSGAMLQVRLMPTWVSAGVYTWEMDIQREECGLQESHVHAQLEQVGSLQRVERSKRLAPCYEIQLGRIGDCLYAPYHDLVAAAQNGILLAGVRPWPSVGANLYVVQRTFVRFMRKQGWRLPWRDESPARPMRLYGRTWVRDTPLCESLIG